MSNVRIAEIRGLVIIDTYKRNWIVAVVEKPNQSMFAYWFIDFYRIADEITRLGLILQ